MLMFHFMKIASGCRWMDCYSAHQRVIKTCTDYTVAGLVNVYVLA